jgi:hypothetical protein
MAVVCLVLCPVLSYAADISGQWKGQYFGDHGRAEILFQFQQNGEQLTGKAGEVAIQEGKVTGDDVSFAVVGKVGKREVKITYTGKLNNGVLELQVGFPGANPDSKLGGSRFTNLTAQRLP